MMVNLSLSWNATLRRNGRYWPVDGVVVVLDANSHVAGGHRSTSSSWCQSRVVGRPLHIDISTGLTYLILKDPCYGRHYLFNSNYVICQELRQCVGASVHVEGCLFFVRR